MGRGMAPVRRSRRSIRVFEADEGVGMTELEAKKFLTESRSVVKLGTVDSSGDPNVHPVWYYFDPAGCVIYALVGKNTKKARNIDRRNRIYFDVDDDEFPYKGVRGKGIAKAMGRGPETLAVVKKILGRYIKKEHPMYAYFLDSTSKGLYVVFKITPRYFSTWDYGKMPPSQLTAGVNK